MVTHDGSFSVDVNHRIKVRDRMRFPMIDDAAAVLTQVEDEVIEAKGAVRFSLVYDISRAHKLGIWSLGTLVIRARCRPG